MSDNDEALDIGHLVEEDLLIDTYEDSIEFVKQSLSPKTNKLTTETATTTSYTLDSEEQAQEKKQQLNNNSVSSGAQKKSKRKKNSDTKHANLQFSHKSTVFYYSSPPHTNDSKLETPKSTPNADVGSNSFNSRVLVPPPLGSFNLPSIGNDDEAMASVLMSWYMAGYHTGYYQAMKQKPIN